MKRLFPATIAMVALVAACSSGAVVVTPVPGSPTAPSTAAPASLAPNPVPSSTLGFVPGTVESPRTVKITTDDKLSFAPNVITVAEGETVTFGAKDS